MRLVLTLMVVLLSFSSVAKPLSYYFEQDVKFDPSIPTPEASTRLRSRRVARETRSARTLYGNTC